MYLQSCYLLLIFGTFVVIQSTQYKNERQGNVNSLRGYFKDNSFGSHGCVDIPKNLSLCYDIGYPRMFLPNNLQHDNINEVIQQSSSWKPLVRSQCHGDVRLFLCSLYAPVCLDEPIFPCRNLCESVKEACEPKMLAYGYSWPEMFDCSKFPGDGSLCIGPVAGISKDSHHVATDKEHIVSGEKFKNNINEKEINAENNLDEWKGFNNKDNGRNNKRKMINQRFIHKIETYKPRCYGKNCHKRNQEFTQHRCKGRKCNNKVIHHSFSMQVIEVFKSICSSNFSAFLHRPAFRKEKNDFIVSGNVVFFNDDLKEERSCKSPKKACDFVISDPLENVSVDLRRNNADALQLVKYLESQGHLKNDKGKKNKMDHRKDKRVKWRKNKSNFESYSRTKRFNRHYKKNQHNPELQKLAKFLRKNQKLLITGNYTENAVQISNLSQTLKNNERNVERILTMMKLVHKKKLWGRPANYYFGKKKSLYCDFVKDYEKREDDLKDLDHGRAHLVMNNDAIQIVKVNKRKNKNGRNSFNRNWGKKLHREKKHDKKMLKKENKRSYKGRKHEATFNSN